MIIFCHLSTDLYIREESMNYNPPMTPDSNSKDPAEFSDSEVIFLKFNFI